MFEKLKWYAIVDNISSHHIKTISDEEFEHKVELEGNDSEAYRLSYYLEEKDPEFF